MGWLVADEPLFSVAGKTALVTGGAKGLGSQVAEALVHAGCNVFVTGRDREACEAFCARMSGQGQCSHLVHDLSRPEEIKALADRIGRQVDRLDILVNNAGTFNGGALEDVTVDDWDRLMEINLRTPFFLIQALLPLLLNSARANDPARIVNIGSIGGLMPQSNGAYAYGCSKAAIHQLTRMLASDLGARYVHVNAIAPGFFPSQMTDGFFTAVPGLKESIIQRIPAKRLGAMDDIGGMVIFLASRAGAYLSGSVIPLDGGFLCAP